MKVSRSEITISVLLLLSALYKIWKYNTTGCLMITKVPMMCGQTVVWYLIVWVAFLLSYPVLILRRVIMTDTKSQAYSTSNLGSSQQGIFTETKKNFSFEVDDEKNKNSYLPFTGGLKLVSFIVYTWPLMELYELWSHYVKLMKAGTFAEFTFAISPLYYPNYWSSLRILIFSSVVVIIFQIFQVRLFVKRDAKFPALFTYVLMFSAFSSALVFLSLLFHDEPNGELVRSYLTDSAGKFIGAFIWIWYMVVSQNVHDTFKVHNKHFDLLSSKAILSIPVLTIFILFSLSI